MRNDKLERLFKSAKAEPAPRGEPGFEKRVMNALLQERRAELISVWDQLNALFPRLAIAATIVIFLSVAADWTAESLAGADLAASAIQISEDWLFATKAF